jgi:hypothetical protein
VEIGAMYKVRVGLPQFPVPLDVTYNGEREHFGEDLHSFTLLDAAVVLLIKDEHVIELRPVDA